MQHVQTLPNPFISPLLHPCISGDASPRPRTPYSDTHTNPLNPLLAMMLPVSDAAIYLQNDYTL